MSYHEAALSELTANAHHAHATSLQREVIELRGQIDSLDRALEGKGTIIVALVEAGVCHAFDLCERDKRIANLAQRLERAVDANQMLRVEYDGLLVLLDSQEVQ